MLIFVGRGIDKEKARQKACESYQNITGKQLKLCYDSLGKPAAENCCVSISHTQDIFLLATSQVEVGIDIERKDRKISPRLGTIEEWTELEAYAKYLGTGITKELIGMQVDKSMLHKVDILEEYIISVYSSDCDITICEI